MNKTPILCFLFQFEEVRKTAEVFFSNLKLIALSQKSKNRDAKSCFYNNYIQ